MGPLISERQRQRVLGYIRTGVDEGATVALGGGVPEHLPVGFFVEPTVLTGVDPGATVAQEEIFGPVLVVLAHDGDDDAVRIANDSAYGLSGAVFSGSDERARAVASRIRTGTISRQRRPVLRARRALRRLQAERDRARDGASPASRSTSRPRRSRRACDDRPSDQRPGVDQRRPADRQRPARPSPRGRPRRRVPRRLRHEAVGRRGRVGRQPPGQRPRPTSGCGRATAWRRSSRTRPRRCSPGGASSAAGRWRCRSTPPTRASTCATSSPTRAPGCWSSRPTWPTGWPRIAGDMPALDHVVVIGDGGPARGRHGAHVGRRAGQRRRRARCGGPPGRPGHVHLHRRHDRPVEGLHAQPQLPRGAGPPDRHLLAAHGRRRGVDAAAAVPLQRHRHRGARAARVRRPVGDLPAVLGVELLAGDEPHGRHRHLDAGHDGLPAGPRRRPARDAALGRARGEHVAAPDRRGAAAGRGRLDPAASASASTRSAAPTA